MESLFPEGQKYNFSPLIRRFGDNLKIERSFMTSVMTLASVYGRITYKILSVNMLTDIAATDVKLLPSGHSNEESVPLNA